MGREGGGEGRGKGGREGRGGAGIDKLSNCKDGWLFDNLFFWFQIAVDNAGKLQAIEAAYYADDGCSINDTNLFAGMGHWDNGRYTVCKVTLHKIMQHSTTQHNIPGQNSTVQHNTTQHTAQHSTAQDNVTQQDISQHITMTT